MVKAGCVFYGYGQPDFPDWKDTYEGPLLVPNVQAMVDGQEGWVCDTIDNL